MVLFLVEALSALSLPLGCLSPPEAVHFYAAHRLAQWGELYSLRRLVEPPLLVCPYTPLYPAFFGLLQRLFGPTPIPGRAVSFLASLLGALAVFRLARRLGAGRGAALFGAMAWLSSAPVMDWGTACTEDVLGVSLELSTLWAGVCGRLWASGALLFLSVLARPTAALCGALALPFALRRRGWAASLSALGGSALALGLLEAATHGGFSAHLREPSVMWGGRQLAILAAALRASPALGRWSAGRPPLFGLWWLVAVSALAAGALGRLPRWLGVYMLAGLAVGVLTSLRLGASTDYFLHFVAACSVGAALGLTALREWAKRGWARWAVALLFVLIGLWDASLWGGAYLRAFPPIWDGGARSALAEATEALKRVRGGVVSVDPSLPISAGKESLVNEPWTFSIVAAFKGQGWGPIERAVREAGALIPSAPGSSGEGAFPPRWRELVRRLEREWETRRFGPPRSPFEVEVLFRPESQRPLLEGTNFRALTLPRSASTRIRPK